MSVNYVVKSEMKTSQIFECGLCRYRTKVKEDLHSHWRSNCNKIKSVNRFNCRSCGNSDLSTEDMKTHWMFCHVKTEPMNETFGHVKTEPMNETFDEKCEMEI